MCLLTTQSKALRAKEDITVYKMFRILNSESIFSPYQGFKYEKLGRQKTIKFNKWKGRGAGFDFSDGMQAGEDLKAGKIIYTISQGYHSCNKYEKLHRYVGINDAVIPCIIPKGSWYYEGYDGLMVSTDLIIPKSGFKHLNIEQ